MKGERDFSDNERHAQRVPLTDHFPFKPVNSSHFSFNQGEVNH